jgi:hypothetical protein
MGTGHLISSVVLIAGFIVLMLYLRKGSRRCRWCRTPTIALEALPEQEQNRIEALVRKEGIDPADSYEFCVTCRRIFDQQWFCRDRDMRDRWCACGSGLKSPWDVDSNRLRQAAADLPREIIGLLLDGSYRDDIARLLGGYDDIMHRDEKRQGGQILRVCEICHRMYMWIETGGYQVFQCVSVSRDNYDRVPDRPQGT